MAASYALRATGEGFHYYKVPGAYYEAIVEVTGDSSYPAGGYAFGLTQLQAACAEALELDSVDVVNPWYDEASTLAFAAVYDKVNGKVLAMAQGTAGAANPLDDVTAATSLAAYTCSLRVRFR